MVQRLLCCLGTGFPRRQLGVGLARRSDPAHGADSWLLSGQSVPLRLPAELSTLHQTSRTAWSGHSGVRLPAEVLRQTPSGQGKLWESLYI